MLTKSDPHDCGRPGVLHTSSATTTCSHDCHGESVSHPYYLTTGSCTSTATKRAMLTARLSYVDKSWQRRHVSCVCMYTNAWQCVRTHQCLPLSDPSRYISARISKEPSNILGFSHVRDCHRYVVPLRDHRANRREMYEGHKPAFAALLFPIPCPGSSLQCLQNGLQTTTMSLTFRTFHTAFLTSNQRDGYGEAVAKGFC